MNANNIISAPMTIDMVIVIGHDERGPKFISLGDQNTGGLAALLGQSQTQAAVVPPAIVSKPAVVAPVIVKPAVVASPVNVPMSNPAFDKMTDEALLALAKERKIKGAHLCKRSKLIEKLSGSKPTPTQAPQTNAAPVQQTNAATTQTNAAPQSNGGFRRGGKSKSNKGNRPEPTLWIPESECFGVGTYTCKDSKDKSGNTLKEKMVAIYDVSESQTQGKRWHIAFLTEDVRPVMDGKGNPTGKMERMAWEFGKSYLPLIDPNNTGKFTLLQVTDPETLGLQG